MQDTYLFRLADLSKTIPIHQRTCHSFDSVYYFCAPVSIQKGKGILVQPNTMDWQDIGTPKKKQQRNIGLEKRIISVKWSLFCSTVLKSQQ
jgi:hypothetical protein